MIIDPINLTNILGAIAWPLFGWLAVRTISRAVVRTNELDLEKLRLQQQHEIVTHVQNEEKGA